MYVPVISIYWDRDSQTIVFSEVGNDLATASQYVSSDRCYGSCFEYLKPGELVELAEGIYFLDKDLDLVFVQEAT